jgi:hypothetical protein
MVWAAEWAPQLARRAAQGRRAAGGAAVRGKIKGGGGELAHHTVLTVNFRQPSYEFTFNVGIDLLL